MKIPRYILLLACAFPLALSVPRVHADDCPAPLTGSGERWDGQRQWQALEQAGYVIGAIEIQVDDVYDTPADERRWYENAANYLHINSSPGAVRAALTIAPGDPVNASQVYQAERNLRDLQFLLDARLSPTSCEDGKVNVLVQAHDAWTLKLSAGFGSVGGQSEAQVRIEDDNFLGTGKSVHILQSSDPERDTTEYFYFDPNVLGSFWTLEAAHLSLSDGQANFGKLAYPFRTYDQPWAFHASGGDSVSTLYFYDAGESAWAATMRLEEQDYRLARLLDYEGDNGWRAGFGWHQEDARYGAPVELHPDIAAEPVLDDRRLSGAYLFLDRFHEHFAGFRNIRAMDRHEDYNLGFNFGLQLGNYTADLGSTQDSLFVGADLSFGSRLGGRGLLLTSGSYSGRRGDDGMVGAAGNFATTAYVNASDNDTLVAHIALDWLDDPDPEQQLYIGGVEGLLGYPQYFQRGEASWQAQLEYRRVTSKVLFRTLRVGYAAFLQGAQVRRREEGWGRTYSDLGAALRLGNLRGSFSHTIYIGVAVPLVKDANTDDWQFMVTDEVTF